MSKSYLAVAIALLIALFYFGRTASETEVVDYLDSNSNSLISLAVEIKALGKYGSIDWKSISPSSTPKRETLEGIANSLGLESINVWPDKECVAFVYSSIGMMFAGESKSLVYCQYDPPAAEQVDLDRPYSFNRILRSSQYPSIYIPIKEHKNWYLHKGT